MNKQNIKELAVQGDKRAIVVLLNQSLKLVEVRVSSLEIKNNCIHLILVSKDVKEVNTIVPFIHEVLRSLSIQSVYKADIGFKILESNNLEWRKEFYLDPEYEYVKYEFRLDEKRFIDASRKRGIINYKYNKLGFFLLVILPLIALLYFKNYFVLFIFVLICILLVVSLCNFFHPPTIKENFKKLSSFYQDMDIKVVLNSKQYYSISEKEKELIAEKRINWCLFNKVYRFKDGFFIMGNELQVWLPDKKIVYGTISEAESIIKNNIDDIRNYILVK